MVAQVVSMVVASTVVTFNAVNIHVEILVAVSTVGNLRAVNVLAGSLVAANIPVGSTVTASTVNAAAMASIATEGERRRYALQLFGTPCRRAVERAPGTFNADFKNPIALARPMHTALGMAVAQQLSDMRIGTASV
jgi:hypothetical protein